jgi:hypothetical protein
MTGRGPSNIQADHDRELQLLEKQFKGDFATLLTEIETAIGKLREWRNGNVPALPTALSRGGGS